MTDSSTNHIYSLLLSSNGIKGSILSYSDSAKFFRNKGEKCFGQKKYYISLSKFYFLQ